MLYDPTPTTVPAPGGWVGRRTEKTLQYGWLSGLLYSGREIRLSAQLVDTAGRSCCRTFAGVLTLGCLLFAVLGAGEVVELFNHGDLDGARAPLKKEKTCLQ